MCVCVCVKFIKPKTLLDIIVDVAFNDLGGKKRKKKMTACGDSDLRKQHTEVIANLKHWVCEAKS